MGKNLIRNGGFERANTDFWIAYDEKSFAVITSPVYKGTYAGKLVADGSNTPYVMLSDYVSIGVGEDMYFEAWIRSSDSNPVFLKALYYDENLDLIHTITYKEMSPSTSVYEQMLESISGMEGAIYVRFQILHNHTTEDHYTLIDNVILYKLKPDEITSRRVLMEDRSAISVTGTVYSEYFFVQPFREAEFRLEIVTCSGTSETLDVTIESRDRLSNYDHVIATFNQVTGAGDDQVLLVTAGVGTKIRVKSVIGGTPTNITYRVEANLKR